MGLAASQARLLTITARKSDCVYQSMLYSHEKIALARDMNIVSAEYQDALTKTKLVYDFYGNGDKSTQLNYALLMNPSKLNNYTPYPITDQSGRVVLNGKFAAAAKAAGIPQEGLGTTPSSDIRDKFIDGLVDNNLITEHTGKIVKNMMYSQDAGLGGIGGIDYMLKDVTFDEFVNSYLGDAIFDFSDLLLDAGGSNLKLSVSGIDHDDGDESTSPSLRDILTGDYVLWGLQWDNDKVWTNTKPGYTCAIDKVGSCDYWDMLAEVLASFVNPDDPNVQGAVEYARRETIKKVECLSSGGNKEDANLSNAGFTSSHSHKKSSKIENWVFRNAQNYVGYCFEENSGCDYNCGYSINLTTMTRAFFTYFAQYLEGLSETQYKIVNERSGCKFIDDDFVFQIVEGAETTGDGMLIAQFYDMLFNQIATKGWVENDQVDDKEYLQTMLQSGAMYISTLADDNYYYQGNYSTNTYIKEITDEEGIAQAEAKYNREKQKINTKENIIDMKMKNLDTEISALSTEYDTIKSVISKHIEKVFKRYNA